MVGLLYLLFVVCQVMDYDELDGKVNGEWVG